jgi:hypothetical protein
MNGMSLSGLYSLNLAFKFLVLDWFVRSTGTDPYYYEQYANLNLKILV